MFYKTLFVTILFQCSCGINSFGETKRQTFMPSAEREMYPNVEDSLEFSDTAPEYLDSDTIFSVNSGDFLPKELVTGRESDYELTPLISRKKRSVPEEQREEDKVTTGHQQEGREDMIESEWNENAESDFLKMDKRKARGKAVFIPRIGKKSEQKRVVFIPRIGKKNVGDLDYAQEKRVVFIPRIGKKSNTDADEIFEAKRAIFIPRIGRGSYFLPKVAPYSPQYKVTRKIVFIPRVG